MSKESLNVHPVACEACRNKKCKCDRLLPSCSQCRKSDHECNYPQSFKRGFPEGYIAKLEQRLIQTELALMQALSIVSGQYSTVDEILTTEVERFKTYYAGLTKPERMQEWTRLPLDTHEQRLQWLHDKARRADVGPNVSHANSSEPPSPAAVGSVDTFQPQRSVSLGNEVPNPRHDGPIYPRPLRDAQYDVGTSTRIANSSTFQGQVTSAPSSILEPQIPDFHSRYSTAGLQASSDPYGSPWSNSTSLHNTGWDQAIDSQPAEQNEELADIGKSPNELINSSKAQSLSSRYSKRFF